MSIFKTDNKEELNKELDRIDEYLAEEDKILEANERESRKKMIWSWLISGFMHATILLIFMTVIYTTMPKNEETPPVQIVYVPEQPHVDKIPKERKLQDQDMLDIVVPQETDKISDVVINPMDLPIDDNTTEDNQQLDPGKHGREDAVASVEDGGAGAFMAIGSGGGDAGMLGSRTKGGKARGRQAMGPHGFAVDSTVDAGLRWLKRHQSPDGRWEAINYYKNCVLPGDKCEPGNGEVGDVDVAMTGYGVLCYLGMGYDHKTPNKYRKVVANGISYLLRAQQVDGAFGERNYEHAIASMALFEAYAMTQDNDLVDPCKKAVKILLDRQSSEVDPKDKAYKTGLGWDYINPNTSRNDYSVSGWCVMSLKSAYAGGFEIKNSLKDFDKMNKIVWELANPSWKTLSPYDKSVFPYTYNAPGNSVDRDGLSFVGGLCSVFLGHKAGDTMLDSLTNDVKARWLDTKDYKNNMYALYYSSLLSYQTQGTWKDWREEYVPYLTDSQIKAPDACTDGTWKFEGQKFHGSNTSQVMLHCYAMLALEVAYRFKIVGVANAKNPAK